MKRFLALTALIITALTALQAQQPGDPSPPPGIVIPAPQPAPIPVMWVTRSATPPPNPPPGNVYNIGTATEGEPQTQFGILVYHTYGDPVMPPGCESFMTKANTSYSATFDKPVIVVLNTGSTLYNCVFKDTAIINICGSNSGMLNVEFRREVTFLENYCKLWLTDQRGRKIKPIGTAEQTAKGSDFTFISEAPITSTVFEDGKTITVSQAQFYEEPIRINLHENALIKNFVFNADAAFNITGTNTSFYGIIARHNLTLFRSGVRLNR